MSNVFKNPLVLSEVVVGSVVDTRAVVLYEQPEDVDWASVQNSTDENGNTLLSLVDTRSLKELFTGYEVPEVKRINGMNIYGISYVKADIDIQSDLCDHPIETGAVITDNAIIQPVSAKIQIAMPTAFKIRIYKEIERYFLEKKFLMLQTSLALYRNMVVQAMPFELKNETIDRPVIELQLRQIMEVSPQYIDSVSTGVEKPLVDSDSNTQNIGRLTGVKAVNIWTGKGE